MEKQLIGKVVHFYPKISVAVVELSAPLSVGDRIMVESQAGSFEQVVSSMQIEKSNIASAMPGQSIGLQTEQRAHKGNKVYKLVG